MTQTALTIPAEPEEDAVELEEVVELRVAESTADVPGPADCRVLCVSDTHVERGDVVRVSFTPPRRFTWGLDWTLHAGDTETIWPLAFLVGGLRDRELRTAWAGEPVGWNDIGFRGRGVWRWEVPDRMTPGVYSIVKDGFAGGSLPIEDRTTIWTVSFEVEG